MKTNNRLIPKTTLNCFQIDEDLLLHSNSLFRLRHMKIDTQKLYESINFNLILSYIGFNYKTKFCKIELCAFFHIVQIFSASDSFDKQTLRDSIGGKYEERHMSVWIL